jgi:Rrf2 family transcriptional regulator, cysteine metabolism repressor
MKISAKTDYACRALLQLALHWPSTEPLSIGMIARMQQIPMKFLPHILLQLKQLGYVDSIRGKSGGYMLGKPPAAIHLSDVLRAFSEPMCMLPATGQRRSRASCLMSIWKEIDEATRKQMDNLNFEEISRRERNLKTVPMFEI